MTTVEIRLKNSKVWPERLREFSGFGMNAVRNVITSEGGAAGGARHLGLLHYLSGKQMKVNSDISE